MDDDKDQRIPTGAHEDVLRWLSRDLDGELPERERILLRDHLDGCARCAEVAEQMQAAERVLHADARPIGPVGLVERTLARIARDGGPAPAPIAALRPVRDRALSSPARNRAPVMLRASVAAAAGLLALAGVAWIATGPTRASAASEPVLRSTDPALLRVLERWRAGRAAPPSFFELLIPPAPPSSPSPPSSERR